MSLLRASNLALDMLDALEHEVDENGVKDVPDELRAVLVEDAVRAARVALRLARVFHRTEVKV